MKKVVVCYLLMMGAVAGNAQTRQYGDHQNAWFYYVGDHPVSPKWGVHLEAQVRRNGLLTNWQQLLLRTGINYHLSDQAFVSLGYAFVESYAFGEFPSKSNFPEHRIWQQLQAKTQLGKFEWVGRLRTEQRYVYQPEQKPGTTTFAPSDNATYSNRIRLLNRLSIPFSGKTIVDGSWYLSFFDELMVNVGQNVGANFLDQNRASIAIGYKVAGLGRLEFGFMEHTIFKADGIKIENNHTFQLGLSSNIAFYKKQ
jgi:hypothetical protein